MNRGRVGEERRGKEMDGCPLTLSCSGASSLSGNIFPFSMVCSTSFFKDGSEVIVIDEVLVSMVI
jgi:hypothetical protein